MTDDEAKAIGLRAVACKGWRWMPGMVACADGHPAIRLCKEVIRFVWLAWPALEHGAARCLQGDVWPDFRDPATLGCLLALVRDAWGIPTLHLAPDRKRGMPAWLVVDFDGRGPGGWHITARTEAEALVAALEAA